MNIFGVGGWELLLIVLIALIVAGPKRIAVWAYQVGLWSAKLQDLWSEFAATLQAEMDEAGVNVEIPKRPPTREELTRSVQKFGQEIAKSAEEPLEDVKQDVEKFRAEIRAENHAISQNIDGPQRADMVNRTVAPPPNETEKADKAPDKPAEATPAGENKDPREVDLGTWGGD